MFSTAGKIGENVWKEMIKEVDINGDGNVLLFLFFIFI